jgi:cytochrome P450
MPNCWPPTVGLTAAEQRRRLKAEVQRQIEARRITEREADDLFECLAREANLGPRALGDPPSAFWAKGRGSLLKDESGS